MRIIGAGWGRTGTTTAAAALEVLGFAPSVQMQTMWEQPEVADAWAAHYAGQTADWQTLLAAFEVSTEWPGVLEWRTFAELWPPPGRDRGLPGPRRRRTPHLPAGTLA